MAPPTVPIEERFAAKIQVDPATDCWIWTGSVRANGYGQFRISTAKNGYPHLFAYEHYIGPIPAGFQIDHLCRNKLCANPAHLEAVTPKVNVARSESPAAANGKKTHCKRGHPLSGPNLYVAKSGSRMCRACNYENCKNRRAANIESVREYEREWKRKRRASLKD